MSFVSFSFPSLHSTFLSVFLALNKISAHKNEKTKKKTIGTTSTHHLCLSVVEQQQPSTIIINSHNNFRNDSEYRDYETVFIIPGPSQMKNRKNIEPKNNKLFPTKQKCYVSFEFLT